MLEHGWCAQAVAFNFYPVFRPKASGPSPSSGCTSLAVGPGPTRPWRQSTGPWSSPPLASHTEGGLVGPRERFTRTRNPTFGVLLMFPRFLALKTVVFVQKKTTGPKWCPSHRVPNQGSLPNLTGFNLPEKGSLHWSVRDFPIRAEEQATRAPLPQRKGRPPAR